MRGNLMRGMLLATAVLTHVLAGKVTEASGTSYVVAWDDGSAPSTVQAGQVIAP